MRRAAPSVCLALTGLLLATCTHLPTEAVQPECTLATPLVPGTPGSPGHLLPSLRNPNGDSELAALMRRFVDDLTLTRTALEARGPRRALAPKHRRLRCAWPTEPKDRTPVYDALAQAYLARVEELDLAGPEAAEPAYRRVIEACRGCHQASCPGPLDLIDSLQP
jgi:hypothetical protein